MNKEQHGAGIGNGATKDDCSCSCHINQMGGGCGNCSKYHDTPKEVESWGNLIEEAKNVHTLIQKEVLTPYQLFLWAKIILQQTKSSTRRETLENYKNRLRNAGYASIVERIDLEDAQNEALK